MTFKYVANSAQFAQLSQLFLAANILAVKVLTQLKGTKVFGFFSEDAYRKLVFDINGKCVRYCALTESC